MMDEIKHIKNLFKKLIKDKNNIFYSADKINRTLLNKSRTSSYKKDKVFYKIYIRIHKKFILEFIRIYKEFPFILPLFNKNKISTDRQHCIA